MSGRKEDLETSTAKRWNELIGPFYGIGKVSRLLGVDEQEIQNRYRERRLLGCEAKNDVLVFPSYQFVQNDQTQSWGLIEGFETVLSVFADPQVLMDDWTLASWLRAKREDLDGVSIEEHLKQGKGVSEPLRIAKEAAWRLSH